MNHRRTSYPPSCTSYMKIHTAVFVTSGAFDQLDRPFKKIKILINVQMVPSSLSVRLQNSIAQLQNL